MDVEEAIEDFRNLIAALLDRQKIAKLFQLSATADSLGDCVEGGSQGGPLTFNERGEVSSGSSSDGIGTRCGVAVIRHAFPTPRGPLGVGLVLH